MLTQITVIDKKERERKIEEEVEHSTQTERFTPFRGTTADFNVIRLPTEYLIYRMGNGRTAVEQMEYITRLDHPDDYFSSGEEDSSVQHIQHGILLRMSKDERASIYLELEHAGRQTERLLITCHGVVVNGNRRLAAMREIYKDDPGAYQDFSHADVMVLPTSTDDSDIETIESELQLIPETKLQYGWIERRLKLRKHLHTLKMSPDKVKRLYRFRGIPDMNRELAQLHLSEEYLIFIGKPHAYREVDKTEEIFKQLQKAIAAADGDRLELRKKLAFALIQNGEDLEERLYNYRGAFGADFDELLERYAEELGIADPPSEYETQDDKPEDDDVLNGLESDSEAYEELVEEALENGDKRKETAKDLAGLHKRIRREKKERKSLRAALNYAIEANRSLHSIDLSSSDPATFTDIRAQLGGILDICAQLTSTLDSLISE